MTRGEEINWLPAEQVAAIIATRTTRKEMGDPTTFKKVRTMLDEGKINEAITQRGSNRIYLHDGQLQFDYMDRSGGKRTWVPCDDHEPTPDDEAALWIPIHKGAAQD